MNVYGFYFIKFIKIVFKIVCVYKYLFGGGFKFFVGFFKWIYNFKEINNYW